MDITGSCISILEPQVFQSKRDGGRVVKYSFVIDTGGQYAKRVCFAVFGDDRFKQMQLVVGKSYVVSFDVESREWQGKWFTECTAWKCVCIDNVSSSSVQQSSVVQPQPVVSQQVSSQPTTNEVSDKDLPF